MLQIYENIFATELIAYKNSDQFRSGDRQLPIGSVSTATVIYDFLHNLHIKRVNYPVNERQKRTLDKVDLGYVAYRLESATERITEQVFGPIPKTPEPEIPPKPETAESVRRQRAEEARIAAARKKLQEMNLDQPIYGNN